jgi:hypothetical protein
MHLTSFSLARPVRLMTIRNLEIENYFKTQDSLLHEIEPKQQLQPGVLWLPPALVEDEGKNKCHNLHNSTYFVFKIVVHKFCIFF